MNPALPKTNLGIYDFGEANQRKCGDSLTELKSRPGIAKKGRAG